MCEFRREAPHLTWRVWFIKSESGADSKLNSSIHSLSVCVEKKNGKSSLIKRMIYKPLMSQVTLYVKVGTSWRLTAVVEDLANLNALCLKGKGQDISKELDWIHDAHAKSVREQKKKKKLAYECKVRCCSWKARVIVIHMENKHSLTRCWVYRQSSFYQELWVSQRIANSEGRCTVCW